MPIDEFLDTFTMEEIIEQMNDINRGGDNLDVIAHYSRVTTVLLNRLCVYIGHKPLPEKVLDPWKEAKPIVEVIAKPGVDPFREMLLARINATKGKRVIFDGDQ